MKVVLVIIVLLLTQIGAQAQVPRTINYQGELRTASGSLVTNGMYLLTFSIYDSPTGGNTLYSESFSSTISDGIVNAVIGLATAMPQSLTFDKPYYLGISINSGAELLPRTELSSVPYALRSDVADGLSENAVIPNDFTPISIPMNGDPVGDLRGTYANAKVIQLQSFPIAPIVPKKGDVLWFNGTSWGPVQPPQSVTFSGGGAYIIPEDGYYHFDASIQATLPAPQNIQKQVSSVFSVGLLVDTSLVNVQERAPSSVGISYPEFTQATPPFDYVYSTTVSLAKGQRVAISLGKQISPNHPQGPLKFIWVTSFTGYKLN
ncbi:MAG TPA: hypothetical protein VFO76_04600 [Candidatus Kapabacteria bacterium]|nr:hypothetical protein [Candidatus Kapabacteria bacterium]